MSSAATPESGGEPKATKIVVLGGNGYVGSHAVREALSRGCEVISVSSSGLPPAGLAENDELATAVTWEACDLLSQEAREDVLARVCDGATAVVSCVGSFGGMDCKYISYKAARTAAAVPALLSILIVVTVPAGSVTAVLEQRRRRRSGCAVPILALPRFF